MGFTVSIFFTELSFGQSEVISEAKLGILSASILAGALGYLLLKWSWRGAKVEKPRVVELRE
jgi:NhaA family Na+:H+ antiporter